MIRVVSLGNYSEANKMSLLDYFRTSKASSASLAKERLQILVAYERSSDKQPSYLPELQKELLAVIQKYVNVNKDAMTINLEQNDNRETLELNIVLPDAHPV
jgi:cell division topological specificity factor